MPDKDKHSHQPGSARCYAIRRANPFLGVLQVIETGAGRAVSANGVVWEIEIHAPMGAGWGSLNRNSRQAAFYRYGLWSAEEGLVTRPLASHLDRETFSEKCGTLIDNIGERLELLPFTLEDKRELWLLDQHDKLPLALLASMIPGETAPSPDPRYWKAAIGANGLASQHRYPAVDELETLVRQRAGFNIKKHWIIRQGNGSGILETGGLHLNADAFPPFLINEQWPETQQAKLISEYIAWIAPSLLTLQQLERDDRARLEKSISVQAVSIEHHWQLYPEIIDENCIRAARVQCRLQKTNSNVRKTK